ncbi:hypothetical protein SDC9_62677 [bioreactor metagenome]|uniref:Uncharacterized protein n=1 Tax=bioreactor metagenome TaxID=1076179 RepID=A0A644XJM2_9ZZZZ
MLERCEPAKVGRVALLVDNRPCRLREETRHRVVPDLIVRGLKISDLVISGRRHNDVLWRKIIHADTVILPHELFEERERGGIHVRSLAGVPSELRKLVGSAV